MQSTAAATEEEPAVLIEVVEIRRGRVSGWAVVCRVCGTKDEAAHSREAGKQAAAQHRAEIHESRGLIRVRAGGARARKAKRGRRAA